MKALSIRQPWAWLIVMGFKPIENRTWATGHRGEILIHASASYSVRECMDAVAFVYDIAGRSITLPMHHLLQRGGFVGTATLTDCVEQSDSRWFVGPYGFVFANPKPTKFLPYKGRLGFFNVPWETREALGLTPF